MPAADLAARPYAYAALEASGQAVVGHLDPRCRDLKGHWWQPTNADDADPWPCSRCVSLEQLADWARRVPDARAQGWATTTGTAAAKILPPELKVLPAPAENSSVPHYTTGNLEDTTMQALTTTPATDLTAEALDTLKNAFQTAIRYGVSGAAEVRSAMLVEYRAGRLTLKAVQDVTDAMMEAAILKAEVAASGIPAPAVQAAEAAAPKPTGPAFSKGMIVTNAAGQLVRIYVSKTGNIYGKVRDDYGTWEYVKGAMVGARHLTADEARAIGIRTEVCVFCATPIETKESLAAGYGPDCADKYGLPWGNKNQG